MQNVACYLTLNPSEETNSMFLQEFLDRLVKDHGSIDLEWLRDAQPDKVKYA